MATTAEQIRSYSGPAVLSYGFRPFFLGGAIWAIVAVTLWLPMLAGEISVPTAFTPLEWHVHELIFGYVPAVIAGFLLTAVPNWTGRLPVTGTPLLALFLIWLAGRLAILASARLGAPLAAAIDVLFLVALGTVIAREIIASGNTRNLKVLAIVLVLAGGNVLFHLEAFRHADHGFGTRIGISAAIFLIILIGGRIIPSFTRNWLVRQLPGRLPAPFDRFDVAVMTASGLALAGWIVMPGHTATMLITGIAALLNFIRLGRWAGERAMSEPLVLILHIGYAFVPIGFLLVALSAALPGFVSPTGALHAWTVGAVGLMTIAVMTRASLGHTGQPLTATRRIQLIYAFGIVAALARVAVAFGFAREPLLHLSALAWVLAFSSFVAVYGPWLTRRQV